VTALGGHDAREGGPVRVRRHLFGKYVRLLVAVVAVPLLAIGGFASWSSYQDQRFSLERLQREQATAAAAKIGQFISEVESQIRLTANMAGATSDVGQRRYALRLLLRQVAAITELVLVDGEGASSSRSRVSRSTRPMPGPTFLATPLTSLRWRRRSTTARSIFSRHRSRT
jgi:hypothetical protein